MLELTIYGIGFFLCILLIQYMLFKFRKNIITDQYEIDEKAAEEFDFSEMQKLI